MATTMDELEEPTEEKFAAYLSLWMNNDKVAPNWVFTLKERIRRVIHTGATVQFILKNGAVYTAHVTQTTKAIDPLAQTRQEYDLAPEQEADEEDVQGWPT